jgi:hypothetical protein
MEKKYFFNLKGVVDPDPNPDLPKLFAGSRSGSGSVT